jgi:hypothetical protein
MERITGHKDAKVEEGVTSERPSLTEKLAE